MPAGKIERGETPHATVLRELAEETGLVVASHAMQPLEVYYVRYPEYDYVYHTFRARVPTDSEARLNIREHQALRWTTPAQALQLDLVMHESDCIQFCYFR